jgi:NAD(P)H-flavin reductase
MSDGAISSVPQASAMAPVPYRVRNRIVESPDSATLTLVPIGEALRTPQPGEFMMLYAFGVGEAAISISGDPTVTDGSITHTIRAVGAVSRALHNAEPGSVVGVRGPFGTTWGLAEAVGRDLVMVAGGVGLCPLRPAVLGALAQRSRYGKVMLIVGARSRTDFIFAAQLEKWADEPQIELHLIVDAPTPGWSGEVGLVTAPLSRLALNADNTTAFLCGPEPMLHFAAEVLVAKGIAAKDIRVSLERNMQCGIGWCGHCQLGPLLLCRDGPVVGYDTAGPLLQVKEL